MSCTDLEKKRAYQKAYRLSHREKHNADNRAWKKAHPELMREINRAYRLSHSEKIRELKRAWNKEHPDKVRESRRAYIDDPVKIKARKRVQHLVARGKLIKPTICPSCKTGTNIEGHHADYLKPEEVAWLCGDCHAEIHSLASGLPFFWSEG